MKVVRAPADLEEFRRTARRLLGAAAAPNQVIWAEPAQPTLFGALQEADAELGADSQAAVRVPQAFLGMARRVLCHRDPERHALLYRVLWRLAQGERGLLDDPMDGDVAALLRFEKAVNHTAHQLRAFLRFRRLELGGGPRYVGYYAPEHRVLGLVAPSFARRFRDAPWSVLTPDEAVHCDAGELSYTPGTPPPPNEQDDEIERLFVTYYSAIYDPARTNLRKLHADLPRKHWARLPEARVIPELVREAPTRLLAMQRAAAELPRTPSFVPEARDLGSLRRAARTCQGCELHGPATQTVFGEGSAEARLVLIGEQPGDQEDRAGRPFVGPAGQLLNEALAEVGLDRSALYLTNAVKHFRFEPRGKARLHQRPKPGDVRACRPWLIAELETLSPAVLVCLGLTASQSIWGATFRLTEARGRWLSCPWAPHALATWHPANVLRAPDEATRAKTYGELVADLRSAAERLQSG